MDLRKDIIASIPLANLQKSPGALAAPSVSLQRLGGSNEISLEERKTIEGRLLLLPGGIQTNLPLAVDRCRRKQLMKERQERLAYFSWKRFLCRFRYALLGGAK